MAIDEALPEAGDPYWEQLTAQTLELLRRLQTAHRRQRLRGLAYAGYVTVLLAAVYVVPYVGVALSTAEPAAAPAGAAAAPVPLAVVAVVLLVVVAAVRDAAWRGPALLDAATVGWLLPAPISRKQLLRPPLRRALAVSVVLGGLIGGVAGVLLRLLGGGSASRLAIGGAATGALAGLLAVAGAGLAQPASGQPARWLQRAGGWLWLPPAALAAAAATWWFHPAGMGGSVGRAITPVALWSGPWGWSAQPLAAAAPTVECTGGAWPAAAAAALATGVGLAWLAYRRIDRMPTRNLRARAASVSAVTASLGTLQPRQAWALIRSGQGWTPSTRRRLPAPRGRRLLLPWRDTTALLRAPSRLLWAVLWLALAITLIHAGAGVLVPQGQPAARTAAVQHLALSVAGLMALYLAAAQLVEPARLDADDPRAPRGLPLTARTLIGGHLVVPLAVLLGGLTVAALAMDLAGAAGWATVADTPIPAGTLDAALACIPLVGAALVSAYRGDIPSSILIGVSTPIGDTGPPQVILWYLRGPLMALVMLIPLASGRAAWLDAFLTALVMLRWARSRAAAILRK
jgi:hypothetical protein